MEGVARGRRDESENIQVQGYIPGVFFKGSSKLIVFFHGNAEDLETSSSFLEYMYKKTGHSVLSVEY